MKKINYFIIVAAILMLIIPLLGCPNAHTDAEWSVITPGYISGNITDWAQTPAQALSYVKGTGTATASKTFTAVADAEFKLCDAGWTNEWAGGKTIEAGGEWVELAQGGANCSITGMTVGNSYTMEIQSTSSTIKVRVIAN